MPSTLVLSPDADGIQRAASLIREGRLVAFPTETVYGLGANALSDSAVAGIFEAKGRPADDPLIVHLASVDDLPRVVRSVPEVARLLAERFWPGALTLILPKQPAVPGGVTAGLDSVGVRVPSHPAALALLRAAGLPIAAPSANSFSRPSPTRAEHVLEDLDGRIDAVLDGGPTAIGVESTIVDLSGPVARLLRPGGVGREEIEAVLGISLLVGGGSEAAGPQVAPGQLDVHYSPRTPLVLVTGEPMVARERLREELAAAVEAGRSAGVLVLTGDEDLVPPGVIVERLGGWGEPSLSAERLFDALRRLDRAGLDALFVRQLADPEVGLGRALADRLRRAASTRIVAE